MSSSYRMELDRWLSQLDVSAKTVLDIGGSQLPVKGRTKSWDVQRYQIADLPNPHVNSPKPDIEIDLNEPIITSDEMSGNGEYITYIRQFNNIFRDNDFDLLFVLEVFDYVYNPANALYIIKLLLKPGGTAWVTFPSQYPLHQPVEDDALRYMPGGITKLAEANGLTIKQMIPRRTETDAIYNAFRVERMRAAKHEDHNISGWIVEFTK